MRDLTAEQIAYLDTWPGQALAAQLWPEGDWTSWLFLGGRGAGKTRAGAEWISHMCGRGVRCALIGPTLNDVREVMIEGPSGLKAVHRHGPRPYYEVSRRRVRWPGGGVAYAFSAEEPERLRGPQFHLAWADEFCAWKAPGETLAMLRMGLRLGETPQLCVTTTPKPSVALRTLMAEPGLIVSRLATHENAHNLAPAFVEGLNQIYGGTRLAQQELGGVVVEDDGQALWTAQGLAGCYGPRPVELDVVVVAVDPPAGSTGDACGIVVAGRRTVPGEAGRAYVLEDATVRGLSPLGWAGRVVAAVRAHGAARVVAEANQGGEMIRSVLSMAGCPVPVVLKHASKGKRLRAEPVAALYEQGRVVHCPTEAGTRFLQLDEELMALGGDAGGARGASPDRADALVWAVGELMLNGGEGPRVMRL